jgi:hypothetical protein
MIVCQNDRLFHYLLGGKDALPGILERGLQPLSSFPESEAWRRMEEALPGFYRMIYETFAQPVLRRPYSNSGVFLTPIDFRLMPGSLLARHARIAVPVDAVDPDWAALTYVLDEARVSLPLTAAHLEQAAALWMDEMVGEWFARNPQMMFFYVPQVAVYQDGGIPVQPGWVEPALPEEAGEEKA